MRKYKMLVNGTVVYTHDKIMADFMNESLTVWQRIILFFSK